VFLRRLIPQSYSDTTSQLCGTRIETLFSCHYVVSAANCMRERRSFSALAASGSPLRRVLWHFLFLHGYFMGPLAINSAPCAFSRTSFRDPPLVLANFLDLLHPTLSRLFSFTSPRVAYPESQYFSFFSFICSAG
jgi:hypothetical protein